MYLDCGTAIVRGRQLDQRRALHVTVTATNGAGTSPASAPSAAVTSAAPASPTTTAVAVQGAALPATGDDTGALTLIGPSPAAPGRRPVRLQAAFDDG